ncbi:MAG: chemotaxis protein CheW [Spirochaetaceae bacterium]|jgi:purine-binding chemotaxis protein CheW|nr:chemotaxis protein CheW [Spirochaetaceae bacterium]
MAVIKDLATVNAELQEQKERVDNLDFKMITFSLAGKDYGVDIMNVKEIAKADKFTYVPNAASFVRGVYNLRGDIIPIIDLRIFFHLPTDKKADGQENMLILRIEDRVYGTIVDKIDKVVGINSSTIQPPHPIFGDINIKFISGVVEKAGDLYIILDVIRIFTQSEEEKQKPRGIETGGTAFYAPPPAVPEQRPAPKEELSDSTLSFVRDSLFTLRRFAISPLNERWFRKRFNDWVSLKSQSEVQLSNVNDAEEFLMSFYSPNTDAFWDDDYAAAVKSALPDMPSNSIQVWNLGCGKGYETYSLACILKSRYPDGHLKIWANDNDIMGISSAPNMVFDLDDVPEYSRGFMSRGKNGYSFNQSIKDVIFFEYHDVLNGNVIPEVDIIVARDLLSFMSTQDQEKLMGEFSEKLKKRGVIILGRNEEISPDDWQPIAKDPVSAYMRN